MTVVSLPPVENMYESSALNLTLVTWELCPCPITALAGESIGEGYLNTLTRPLSSAVATNC
jgi:hypothetical protein